MYNYEQSKTETKGATRTNKTRQSVYKEVAGRIERDSFREQEVLRRKKLLDEKGNGKFIMNGSNDRVNGLLYNVNDDNLYKTPDDKKSYHYGYTVHGLRRLEALVWTLEKEGKLEEAMNIGYKEGQLNVPEEMLGNLVNYSSYMEGYNSAKKGKGSR